MCFCAASVPVRCLLLLLLILGRIHSRGKLFALVGNFFALVAGRNGERKGGERKEEGKKKRRKRIKENQYVKWGKSYTKED